ncbi:hypothetical protein BESB_033800 [Besnoitia besnoiti]|uniref:SRS domain-containing protein n=1 Tax=Besnoitia besnoiti TaxID=94643 RepID=A0A2A9MMW9_BESBE|nr:hypothetical protein BESB_033800 [Besnoitia besnoiti]PFH36922.1 hypothetical protein BESB_033800 [Besnoitia besnoiti]
MRRFRNLNEVTGLAAAVLVAVAILGCHSSFGQPASDGPKQDVADAQVCDDQPGPSNPGVTLTLHPNQKAVSFKCTETRIAKLYPTSSSQNVCVDPNCDTPQSLNQACPGARLTEVPADGDGNHTPKTFTLTVPEKSRPEKDLHYKCKLTDIPKHSEGRDRIAERVAGGGGGVGGVPQAQTEIDCVITIKVKSTQQEHVPESQDQSDSQGPPHTDQPNSHAVITECNKDTETANLSAEKPLQFRCQKGHVLRPSSITNVYDNNDGQCTKEVQLSSILKATLKPPKSQVEEGEATDYYELALETAPVHDAALCYRCVLPELGASSSSSSMRTAASEKKECLLKVSVNGTEGPASLADVLPARQLWLLGPVIFCLLSSSL